MLSKLSSLDKAVKNDKVVWIITSGQSMKYLKNAKIAPSASIVYTIFDIFFVYCNIWNMKWEGYRPA